ncbi:hypothetical protein E2562_034502 [Oryza meyeriana var. granulata]|uniref:Uncharacterized protein n=1 Tax=Oryza meyeriana var. granulata TaxID=110450 RepID=A0A6G1CWB5_9ORYZ|nr:hypothetical protein E2562_034502 [Oryza meyeriana var. granulata]
MLVVPSCNVTWPPARCRPEPTPSSPDPTVMRIAFPRRSWSQEPPHGLPRRDSPLSLHQAAATSFLFLPLVSLHQTATPTVSSCSGKRLCMVMLLLAQGKLPAVALFFGFAAKLPCITVHRQ